MSEAAEPTKQYRLITRSDFDGLACAILLKELDMINDIMFVHPKDMQDGKVSVTGNDITTNLPFVPGAAMAFDHHASEATRVGLDNPKYVNRPDAPSAARVVYDHLGGAAAFPRVTDEFMDAVDKADSAGFEVQDLTQPKGWLLLNFLTDSRTGLGRFREFRISNYNLMMKLIDVVRDSFDIEKILADEDVAERVQLYNEQHGKAMEQIWQNTKVDEGVAVLDLRDADPIYAINRFAIYGACPDAKVSIHVMWGREKQNVVLAVGRSIFAKGIQTQIGDLMLKYGGGGHAAAGTCQVATDQADAILAEVVAALKQQIS